MSTKMPAILTVIMDALFQGFTAAEQHKVLMLTGNYSGNHSDPITL